MGGSFRVARIAGIEVRVHITFFLILAFYGWLFWMDGGWAGAMRGVAFVLALFFCVLLHEFGHALAARAFGIRTPDITLLPIGGVARLERMPHSPWQELAIALAGPAVNVAIAIVLLPVAIADFTARDLEAIAEATGGFGTKLLAANVLLVLFNLIPAFPMDGGRVLRAILALGLPFVLATRIAVRVGQGIAVLFALGGLFGNPMLILIALVVFFGAKQELEAAMLLQALGGRSVGDVMEAQFDTLPAFWEIETMREFVRPRAQPFFPVVDPSLRVVGLAGREDLLAGRPPRRVPVLHAASSAMRALAMMQAAGYPVLPVVNPSGQLVGLLSLSCLRQRL